MDGQLEDQMGETEKRENGNKKKKGETAKRRNGDTGTQPLSPYFSIPQFPHRLISPSPSLRFPVSQRLRVSISGEERRRGPAPLSVGARDSSAPFRCRPSRQEPPSPKLPSQPFPRP